MGGMRNLPKIHLWQICRCQMLRFKFPVPAPMLKRGKHVESDWRRMEVMPSFIGMGGIKKLPKIHLWQFFSRGFNCYPIRTRYWAGSLVRFVNRCFTMICGFVLSLYDLIGITLFLQHASSRQTTPALSGSC